MRTRKDTILEYIFGPLGVIMVVGGLLLVGTMATSCKSSISTEAYKAEFEQAQPLNTLPTYTGEKQVVQLATLNVNKELWDMFPELRDKRVGMGVSNRIVENFEFFFQTVLVFFFFDVAIAREASWRSLLLRDYLRSASNRSTAAQILPQPRRFHLQATKDQPHYQSTKVFVLLFAEVGPSFN